MKKPTDPRNHGLMNPKTYITVHESRSVSAPSGPTVATVKELIKLVPNHIPDFNIKLIINHKYGYYSPISMTAAWEENIPNKELYKEMALYKAAIDKYESDLKDFAEYQKRKAQGEQESLEDEIARLKNRLAIKEQELAKRFNNDNP